MTPDCPSCTDLGRPCYSHHTPSLRIVETLTNRATHDLTREYTREATAKIRGALCDWQAADDARRDHIDGLALKAHEAAAAWLREEVQARKRQRALKAAGSTLTRGVGADSGEAGSVQQVPPQAARKCGNSATKFSTEEEGGVCTFPAGHAGWHGDEQQNIWPPLQPMGPPIVQALHEVIPGCQCYRCLDEPDAGMSNPTLMRMVVCAYCGNKRCPRALSHVFVCTRSNEPGQIHWVRTEPASEVCGTCDEPVKAPLAHMQERHAPPALSGCTSESPVTGDRCARAAGHEGSHSNGIGDGPARTWRSALIHATCDAIDEDGDGYRCALFSGHDGFHEVTHVNGSLVEWASKPTPPRATCDHPTRKAGGMCAACERGTK